jgi:hypothetical protein
MDLRVLGLQYQEQELEIVHKFKDLKSLFIQKNKVFMMLTP